MKTAFSSWNNRVAPVFDVARQFILVEIHEGRITRKTEGTMPPEDLGAKAQFLAELGVNTLVCGAISRLMQSLVVAYGITLVPFVAGDLQEVVRAWLEGRIHDRVFAMPGCRPQAKQNGGRRGMSTRNGRGRRGMSDVPETGPCGTCICPQCSYREPHDWGTPCSRRQCPVCGSPLIRG